MRNDTNALNDAIGDSLREYNEYNLVKSLDNVPVDDHVPMLTASNYGIAYDDIQLHGSVHPFIPVHKKQLQHDNGMPSQAYAITIGDDRNEVGIVKAGYTMVDNREISEIGAEIRDTSGFGWKPVKAWCNGKQFREIHEVIDPSVGTKVPEVGDVVTMIMEVVNSYDSTLRAGVMWYPMVLSCFNGNRSKRYGWQYLFKHNANGVNWQDEIRKAGNILKNQSPMSLQAFASACGKLQKPIGNEELRVIRQGEHYLSKLPPQRFAQTMDEYLNKQDFTAWGLLQAGTNVLWHKDKMTNADFTNNTLLVDGMLRYGEDTYHEEVDPNQLEIAIS